MGNPLERCNLGNPAGRRNLGNHVGRGNLGNPPGRCNLGNRGGRCNLGNTFIFLTGIFAVSNETELDAILFCQEILLLAQQKSKYALLHHLKSE